MSKRAPLYLYLIIAIPATSVIMGGVSIYFAYSDPDQEVIEVAPAMSKTSWRDATEADEPGEIVEDLEILEADDH